MLNSLGVSTQTNAIVMDDAIHRNGISCQGDDGLYGSTSMMTDEQNRGIKRKRSMSYICLDCKMHFHSRYEIEEHNNAHAGATPFRCQICSKAFSRRSSLWNHRRIHLELRPFKCPLCDCRFKWKNSLRCHRVVHVRQDPNIGQMFDQLSQRNNLSYKLGARSASFTKKRRSGRDLTSEREMNRARDRLILNLFDQLDGRKRNTDLYRDQDEQLADAARSNEAASVLNKCFIAGKNTFYDLPSQGKVRRGPTIDFKLPNFKLPNFKLERNEAPSSQGAVVARERAPLAVSKEEREAVAKIHYAYRSQFLYRTSDPVSTPYRCVLLPVYCETWTIPEVDKGQPKSDVSENQESTINNQISTNDDKIEKKNTCIAADTNEDVDVEGHSGLNTPAL